MSLKRLSEWRKLPVTLTELCIDTTLRCGQSFRWRKFNDEWRCSLHGRILSLKQDPDHLHYRVAWPEQKKQSLLKSEDDDTEALLKHYFSLDLDLGLLYEQWSKADPNFSKRAPTFAGVRILNQDAWEALIAFICSSNNNIPRISQMVRNLCKHYGASLGEIDGEEFHDFPPATALAGKQVESHLRELGFGYRAKYIAETARVVALEKPQGWLETLRNPAHPGLDASHLSTEGTQVTYRQAHEELLSLAGVGPKVADCVCLMGLGWGESVPVDTHVWQIAQRDYNFGRVKSKTFNKVMYDAVGDHFRGLWGRYAGWAHSVLFTADLREFSDRVIKKEKSSQRTVVKQEVLEDSSVDEKLPVNKRKFLVETEVKTEIKVDNVQDGPAIVELHRRSKRRRAQVVP